MKNIVKWVAGSMAALLLLLGLSSVSYAQSGAAPMSAEEGAQKLVLLTFDNQGERIRVETTKAEWYGDRDAVVEQHDIDVKRDAREQEALRKYVREDLGRTDAPEDAAEFAAFVRTLNLDGQAAKAKLDIYVANSYQKAESK